VAPGGMPKPLLARVHAEILRAVQSPEVRERLLGDGMDISSGTPEAFGKVIRDDFAKWKRLVKETGISAN